MDGALPVVERTVGPAAAERAARAMHLPGTRPPEDGGGTALAAGLRPVHLHDHPGFAFDGALRDIAGTEDTATARWVAKSIPYPETGVQLAGAAWP